MSETQDTLPPEKEPVRFVPGQPLPRLWKTEPDPEEQEDADETETSEEPGKEKKKKKPARDKDIAVPRGGFFSRAKAPDSKPAPTRPAKPRPRKKKAEDEPNGEKKVLLEETPAFDTIESRQRARMIVGGLMVFCMLILGWIVYGMIFSGSDEFGVDGGEMPIEAMNPTPGPSLSREPEARYMLDLAREHAKKGKIDVAIAMLSRIVAVYKGTEAAAEAQAALDRPGQGLPLFPDRPFVLASKAGGPGTPAGSTVPPSKAAPRPRTPPAGPARAGSSIPPVPPGMPPPQVARAGTSGNPPASAPRTTPPGGSQNPGTVGPAPAPGAGARPGPVASNPPPGPPANPGASPSAPPQGAATNPGTASPPPPTGPAMGPNIARNSPPPGQPGAGTASPPSAPAPGSGPGANAGGGAGASAPPGTSPAQPGAPPPPPPGPGEVAIVIPGPGAGSNAMPPAGGNTTAPDAADNHAAATPGRTARMLPPGFKPRLEAGPHESGWPRVIVGDRDGAIMVLVPGGTFTMGSDAPDVHAGPAHAVQLSAYYIDQHEVTNRQFRLFLQDTRYHGQPPGKWLTDSKLRAMPDDAPIVQVSYQDAEEYAIWALKRLPTEAQWEMAARSADGRRSPWGDEPPRWSRPRKLQQIDRVMSFSEDVSPYGVFDLAGNAVEWVRDWYDPAYYARLRDKTTLDPTGPPSKRHGIQRVVKGNSRDWLMFARQGMDSDRRLPYVGFRCTLAVEGGEASALITPHPPQPNANQPGTPPPGQGGGNDVPF